MSKEQEAEVAEDKNASSQSSEGPACADDKQGGEEEPGGVVVPAPKKARKRVVAKKVVMETAAPPAFGIDITDPLFFAGLSVMHRKAKQEERKTKLSSLPIA